MSRLGNLFAFVSTGGVREFERPRSEHGFLVGEARPYGAEAGELGGPACPGAGGPHSA